MGSTLSYERHLPREIAGGKKEPFSCVKHSNVVDDLYHPPNYGHLSHRQANGSYHTGRAGGVRGAGL